MEISKDNVKKLLEEIDRVPSKDFGQNFLIDSRICKTIVDLCEINKNESVLEIGPGLGSLTHFLSETTSNLTCVEIDEKLTQILCKIYNDKSINFVQSDIMNFKQFNYDKIIGNLPYNITTDLVINLLLNYSCCKRYVLMVQAEAFNRFSNLSGKEYGPASILVHLIGNVKKELIVKPGSFYPAPHCNSLVFSIDSFENVDTEHARQIYLMSKQLFINRRKTILNNLSLYCGKQKAIEVLNELNIEFNTRPEQISVQKFEQIYDLLNK